MVHTNDKYASEGAMWNSSYEPAGSAGTAYLVFDLGATKQVTSLLVWNYNEKDYQGRSIKETEVSVSVSADGKAFTSGQMHPQAGVGSTR